MNNKILKYLLINNYIFQLLTTVNYYNMFTKYYFKNNICVYKGLNFYHKKIINTLL